MTVRIGQDSIDRKRAVDALAEIGRIVYPKDTHPEGHDAVNRCIWEICHMPEEEKEGATNETV